jgi:hypothetical protein
MHVHQHHPCWTEAAAALVTVLTGTLMHHRPVPLTYFPRAGFAEKQRPKDSPPHFPLAPHYALLRASPLRLFGLLCATADWSCAATEWGLSSE